MRLRRIVLVVVLIALLVGVAVYYEISLQNSTIQLVVSKPDSDSSVNEEYFTFAGLADMTVLGECYSNTNISSPMCDIRVQVAISTNSSNVNSNLATKSVTLELLGSQFSQLAAVSYENSNVFNAHYTKDNSGDVSAIVYTPALFGGSTWNFEFYLVNAPTNSTGQANLNLVVAALLVHTGMIGHDYIIQTNVLFPLQNCSNPFCIYTEPTN